MARNQRAVEIGLRVWGLGFAEEKRRTGAGLPRTPTSCGASETWHGLSIDSRAVVGQIAERNKGRLAQSKGLIALFPSGDPGTVFGVAGWLKRGKAYLLILQLLLAKFLGITGKGLFNLKDLLAMFPSGGRTSVLGVAGWLKRGKAYLLIPQWLYSRLVRMTGEGMLNLKDFLAMFPSGDRAAVSGFVGD